MKKAVVLLAVVICLLFLACCGNKEPENQPRVQRGEPSLYIQSEDIAEETESSVPENSVSALPEECRLIVNGKDITKGNYVRINHAAKHAELPVTAILKELGYNAEMKYIQDTDSYVVIIDEETEFLDTQYEYYGFPPGFGDTDYVRRIVDNEIIVDSNSIFTIMYWAYYAEIEIDYSTNTVYINSHDPYAYTTYGAKLVVNGKDITEGNCVSILEFDSYTDVELPLLAVVTELGAEVEWQSETVVSVAYKGNTEIYDASESDFGVYGPEGGACIRRVENGDLIFDLNSIEGILENVYGVTVKVDKENRIIYVDSIK